MFDSSVFHNMIKHRLQDPRIHRNQLEKINDVNTDNCVSNCAYKESVCIFSPSVNLGSQDYKGERRRRNNLTLKTHIHIQARQDKDEDIDINIDVKA